MLIFLTGLPGSGKTTLGKAVCDERGMEFIDLDDIIEAREGKAIDKIFMTKGEDYFRELEATVLRESADKCQGNAIISTGGGAPCFHNNMDFINGSGVSVFIDVAPRTLAIRLLEKGLDERPLLKDFSADALLERLETLRKDRWPVYQTSSLVISDDSLTAEKLWELLKDYFH